MPLTNCPDCGHRISGKAPNCPNCGRAIPRHRTAWSIVYGICAVVLLIVFVTIARALITAPPSIHRPPEPTAATRIELPCDMTVISNDIFHLAEPYLGAKRLGKYKAGDAVRALQRVGDWYKVKKGIFLADGWVHKGNLKPNHSS